MLLKNMFLTAAAPVHLESWRLHERPNNCNSSGMLTPNLVLIGPMLLVVTHVIFLGAPICNCCLKMFLTKVSLLAESL